MWKKDEPEKVSPEPRPASPPPPGSRMDESRKPASPVEQAAIGRSIRIQGDVTGDEDLLIQGTIDGSVTLEAHALTVGPDGDVRADIRARVVTVQGRVKGNLNAEEQVILQASSRVQGDISAPRVVLEDGARFRGEIDMGDPDEGLSVRSEDGADEKGGPESSGPSKTSRAGVLAEGETAGTATKGAPGDSGTASVKDRIPAKTGS